MIRSFRFAIACAVLATSTSILAETTTPAGQVATIVTIKTPPGVTRERLDSGFAQAVPLYEKISGLLRKYFIVNQDSFGGMYLWKDRASADAWHNEAWRAKAKATYGVEPVLVYFDAPVQIENIAKAVGK